MKKPNKPKTVGESLIKALNHTGSWYSPETLAILKRNLTSGPIIVGKRMRIGLWQ